MKIHEIVIENQVDEANLLGTVLGAGAKALGKGAEKAAPKELSWAEKAFQGARKAKAEKALASRKSEMLAFATKHYGEETIKLFKTLNLIDIVLEWSWEYYQLQLKKKAGMSQEDYEAALAQLNGQKLIQWLAPKVTMAIANKASILVRWIPLIAQWAKFPATAQLMKTIPAVVANGAFIAFFASPAGRQWVQNVFGDLITGAGKIPMYLSEFVEFVTSGFKQGKEVWDKANSGDSQGAQPAGTASPANDIGSTSTGPSNKPDEEGELTGTKDEYGQPMRKKKLTMPGSSTPGWDQGNFSLGDIKR